MQQLLLGENLLSPKAKDGEECLEYFFLPEIAIYHQADFNDQTPAFTESLVVVLPAAETNQINVCNRQWLSQMAHNFVHMTQMFELAKGYVCEFK